MKRAVLIGVFALAACSGPAVDEFPVGFFGVRSPEDVRYLAGMGFNACQTYLTAPGEVSGLALEARRRKSLLLVSPGEIRRSTMPASAYPGVWWYLQDEPDVHGMDGAAMKAIEAEVKAWAPRHRTAFVVGDGDKAKNYPDVADVIMVDWYPVPHRPLESTGDHVRMTAATAGDRKLWAVLQAMDWSDFAPRLIRGKKFQGRYPTKEETRFMSYDAVLGGATGVWYFIYEHPVGRKLSHTPYHMESVASVARELRAMAPIFARGRPIDLPFEVKNDAFAARAWTYRGRDYLVLANRTADKARKVPAAALEPTWRPLFEVRRDPRELLMEHNGSHYLKPYQVLVLESRLRPGRLLGL